MLTISFLLTVILFTFAASAKAWTIAPVFSEEQKDTRFISRYSSLKTPSLWDYISPTAYCDIQSNENPVHGYDGSSCSGGARSKPHNYVQNTTTPSTTNTTTTLCDRKTTGVREIANIVLRLIIGAVVLYGFLIAIPTVSVFLVYKLSIWSVRYLS